MVHKVQRSVPQRSVLPLILLRLTTLGLLFLFPSLSYAANPPGQFFQPGAKRVWRVGEIMTIEYQTTLTNYTIALWQEALPKANAARKGPILYRTTTGPDTGFKWEVQLYGLDLKESNMFFLWLKEGGPDNQDNMNANRMSTPYFNITNAPLPDTTSKSPTTTQLSTSSEPSTSTSESTTSLSLTTSSSTSTETISLPTGPSAVDDPESSSRTETGLPVGVQAGIGVGVSAIGLACIFCAFFWYRHLKKKRQLLAGAQQKDFSSYSPAMRDPWKVSEMPPGHFHSPPAELRGSNYLRPTAELRNGFSPVEIGAGRDFAEMPTTRDSRPSDWAINDPERKYGS